MLHQAKSIKEENDELILIALRGNDPNAYETLSNKFFSDLQVFFRNRGTGEDASDLASETVYAVFKALPKGQFLGHAIRDGKQIPCTLRTYCYTIARHILAKHLRNSGRVSDVPLTEDDNLDALTHLDKPFETIDVRGGIYGAQNSQVLPGLLFVPSEGSFAALTYFYVDNLSHEQAAREMSSRPETFNTRLQEGRKQLKKLLAHSDLNYFCPAIRVIGAMDESEARTCFAAVHLFNREVSMVAERLSMEELWEQRRLFRELRKSVLEDVLQQALPLAGTSPVQEALHMRYNEKVPFSRCMKRLGLSAEKFRVMIQEGQDKILGNPELSIQDRESLRVIFALEDS